MSYEAVRSQLPAGEEIVPFLLALLNVLSPHRFLGARAELLADIGPIHARWLQFLRQYLESIQPQLRREQVPCPGLIEIDVRRATIGGVHIAQLQRLADLDKERIAEFTRCPMIHESLDRALLESLNYPLPTSKNVSSAYSRKSPNSYAYMSLKHR